MHCDIELDLWPSLRKLHWVWCIYLLYSLRYELQIWCVNASSDDGVLHTIFTVTLTSDIVLRSIVSGTYLLYSLREEFHLVCICILVRRSVTHHFWITLTLTSNLVCRIIVSRTYLLYYLRWESQVWCVDASWDGRVLCTIYGSLWPKIWPLTSFLK